jgi:hypothetical protein
LALGRGLPANHHTIEGAAKAGSPDKVRCLHEVQKYRLPTSIDEWATIGGNLELLSWLRERGRTFDRYTSAMAAGAGHKHVLCYLREQGCEWDARTVAAAAEQGHLSREMDDKRWLPV